MFSQVPKEQCSVIREVRMQLSTGFVSEINTLDGAGKKANMFVIILMGIGLLFFCMSI